IIEDETDDHYEARRIVDWTAGRVVTVDRAFSFTPDVGDHVELVNLAYVETMRGTDGANTTVPDAAGTAAGLIGALNDISAAEVNAEVDTALTDYGANTTAPDNTNIVNIHNIVKAGGTGDAAAIKAKTDGLNFTGTDVKATLDGEEVVTDAASRLASKADVSGLSTLTAQAARDAMKLAPTAGAPDAGSVDKHLDDASTFDPASDEVDIGKVKGVAVAGVADFKATGFSTHSAGDVVTALLANGYFKQLLAFSRGKVVIAGDVVTFYDTDDTTPLHVFTLAAGGRTVA
ncbi:MAG TPA: hypothetical protein VMY35_08010, partial [Phycisphaerae bacterium]|nr:hypothetical protein [Phycisphaerae bacterium]